MEQKLLGVVPASYQRDPETYAVIGAAMRVHQELGPGFAERVYVEGLKIEMTLSNIPFRTEVDLPVLYRGQRLACGLRVDMLAFTELLVETKALNTIDNGHRAQTISYLKATMFDRALLLNFGALSLQYEYLPNRFKNHAPKSS